MADNVLCSVDGCDKARAVGRLGYCNAHYLRFRRHGDPQGGQQKARWGEPSKWLRRHVMHDDDACLKWPFATGRDGRGRIARDLSPQAHRAMCILAHGEPPSSIHEAAHSCGQGHQGCVNPRHLYWATPVENAADRQVHGTEAKGERVPQAKLTEADVLQIRALKGKATQREIGIRFGVDAETVGNIHRRETWAWL
jgi:hypothetical protein